MAKRMLAPTVFHIEGVGKVKFHRNLRAKRLSISISPKAGIRVTIPHMLPFEYAKDFVESKRHWVIEKQKEITSMVVQTTMLKNYNTRERTLKYFPSKGDKICYNLTNNEIRILYPEQISEDDERVQTAARHAIEHAYRLEALGILPLRVETLANLHGFQYNTLRVKNIHSRWGSCSAKNNINLSIYLMKLPEELIDYVILHELTHTVHKNHAKEFWDSLINVLPNAKNLASRIKKYRTGI